MTIEISSASGFEITKIFVSVTMVTSAAMHFLSLHLLRFKCKKSI